MFIGERKGKKGIGHSSREGHIYPLSKSSSVKPIELSFSCLCTAAGFCCYSFHILPFIYYYQSKGTFFFFFFNVVSVLRFLSQFDSFINISLFCLFTVLSGFNLYRNFSPYCYYSFFFPFFFFYVFLFQQYKKKNGSLKISQQANRVQNLESARVLVKFFFFFNLLG